MNTDNTQNTDTDKYVIVDFENFLDPNRENGAIEFMFRTEAAKYTNNFDSRECRLFFEYANNHINTFLLKKRVCNLTINSFISNLNFDYQSHDKLDFEFFGVYTDGFEKELFKIKVPESQYKKMQELATEFEENGNMFFTLATQGNTDIYKWTVRDVLSNKNWSSFEGILDCDYEEFHKKATEFFRPE